MRRLGIGLLYVVIGYIAVAVASHFLTGLLSPNVDDRAVEAAMTSAFVWGPLGAVTAFIVGFVRSGGA